MGLSRNTPQRHRPQKLGPTALPPIQCSTGANWDFAKPNFCFKVARGALKSCQPYSHPCSSGSVTSVRCGSSECTYSCSSVHGKQAASAALPARLPEQTLSVPRCMWKISICAMVLSVYAAICPIPAVKQGYFCRAAEDTALNYHLQQWDFQQMRRAAMLLSGTTGWLAELQSSVLLSVKFCDLSKSNSVGFFKFIEGFMPSTFVISSWLFAWSIKKKLKA